MIQLRDEKSDGSFFRLSGALGSRQALSFILLLSKLCEPTKHDKVCSEGYSPANHPRRFVPPDDKDLSQPIRPYPEIHQFLSVEENRKDSSEV